MDRPSVVAGDKFHAAGERSAWLSPRFVLNGGQWRLRSVQTCQSSRSQKAGMTFCLLVGVIGPLFTHCRKSTQSTSQARRLQAVIAEENKLGSGFTHDPLTRDS